MEKIRIAIVKLGGLSTGGTEKFLQYIAANVSKNLFSVTYFYSDSVPYIGSDFIHPGTDIRNYEFLKKSGVNLIEYSVEYKDITKPDHPRVNTDFWNLFNENNFDVILTGRAGHIEYPFNKIKNTPIVDSIHFLGGIDNQFNISRVLHISNRSAKKWTRMGGDGSRIRIVSHPMYINYNLQNKNMLREKHLLGFVSKYIFGFHQRSSDDIYSSIPLNAYKKVESDNTAFVILGGSSLYKRQAKRLGLKNFLQIKATGDKQYIYEFLNMLDVYAHGRKDGEVNSTAMAEAMYFGLPIISHTSKINNGHIECIGNAGIVTNTIEEYADEMAKLLSNKKYYIQRKNNSYANFQEKYKGTKQIKNIEGIIIDAVKNPFPNKMRRYTYSFISNMRYLVIKMYYFVKNL